MLTRMTNKNEKGFTLIELMIVIAIIGILAAIAIPQFNAYRGRSFNAGANTDIRNIMTAQTGYFIDNDTYSNGLADLENYYGVTLSAGVSSTTIVLAGNQTTYSIRVWNANADTYAVTYTVEGPDGAIDKLTPN